VGENTLGLPYFTKPPKTIVFETSPKEILYVYRNPSTELHRLFKESTNFTGVSDIDYNYAIAQNVEGVFVIRGALTKCCNSEELKVLLLKGPNEKPTDLMKANQKSFTINSNGLPPVGSNEVPTTNLSVGDRTVHVFNLIEFLIERGYYTARNDGVYGPLLEHAVKRLQLDLDLPNLNGVYDEWVYRKLTKTNLRNTSLTSPQTTPVG
jgi:hypothetical protein